MIPMLSIEHTAAEGTLIHGTARGDGTNEILKTHRWRFSRNLGGWYIPRSRDTAPKTHIIDATAADLRAAGHTVEVTIDTTPRPAAEVEADRATRAQDRAAALAEKATRKARAAQVARDRAEQAMHKLPPGGEPIKIGHHSEARHRAAIDTAHRRMGQAVTADQEAARAARRASSAQAATGPDSPAKVTNKIEKLRVEERSVLRLIDGTAPGHAPATGTRLEHLQHRLEATRDHLAYWQGVRAEQIADGQTQEITAEDVSVGDWVHDGGRWLEVQRVNRKTVTVRLFTCGNASVAGRRRYDQLQQLRKASA